MKYDFDLFVIGAGSGEFEQNVGFIRRALV